MENIVPPHWVVTNGRLSWDPSPRCRSIVTWKGLMYIHTQIAAGSELVSLEITKTIATLVILESVLVLLITETTNFVHNSKLAELHFVLVNNVQRSLSPPSLLNER